jgi:sortase A
MRRGGNQGSGRIRAQDNRATGVWVKISGFRRARPVILAASIACIAAAIAIAAQIGWLLHSSSVHGAALIHHEHRAIAAANQADCQGQVGRAGGSSTGPQGLLEAPALGLVAPVEEGISDSVLNDAVGHVSASAWPGDLGTAVFSAHDVTWFSRIDHLAREDEIRYITPCRTYVYRVTAHRVVAAGSPVYNLSLPRIVLETCYPLDALYPTNRRYLVYATLATTLPTYPSPPLPPGSVPLTVPAAKGLAAQRLDLGHNDGPVGVLRFTGSPSPVWRQTNGPLRAEAAALAAYFGVIRSAGQDQRTWWASLAPSVPVSAAAGLWGGEITGYDSHLDVTLRVQGDRTLGAKLTGVVTTGASAQPGTYDLTVTETVNGGGELLVSGFTMRPARS